jgi:hypothetical protein
LFQHILIHLSGLAAISFGNGEFIQAIYKIMKKFKKSEIVLLALVVLLIGVSEYYFMVEKEPLKAIFIGLWCPTILGFLIIFNIKR